MSKLTPDQLNKLQQMYTVCTDETLAKEFNVSVPTIRYHRKRLGLGKHGKEDKSPDLVAEKEKELARQRYFRHFKNSKQYETLLKIYTTEEIDYYMEEYWNYIAEIEADGDILHASEQRALDSLIQTKIRINRFALQETKLLKVIETSNDPQEIAEARNKLEKISKELKGMQAIYLDIHKSLEMTRQERSKKNINTRINIFTILDELKDAKLKKAIGYWCALSEQSMKKILSEWRQQDILVSADEDFIGLEDG